MHDQCLIKQSRLLQRSVSAVFQAVEIRRVQTENVVNMINVLHFFNKALCILSDHPQPPFGLFCLPLRKFTEM